MKIKFLAVLSITFVLFNTNVNALENNDVKLINNHNIPITEKEYNNLLSLGYNETEIRNLNIDEYNANKDITGEVISQKIKYYKTTELVKANNKGLELYGLNGTNSTVINETELSEEEYYWELEKENSKNDILETNQDSIQDASVIGTDYEHTSYKNLSTQILKLSTGGYKVRSIVTWNKMPLNRQEDLLSTEVSNNVSPIDSSLYGKQIYELCNDNGLGNDCIEDEIIYRSGSSKWIFDGDRIRTLKPNLKNDEGAKKAILLMITMEYNIEKNKDYTVTLLDSYAKYQHWRPDGYDSMRVVHAQASVNW